MMAMAGPPSSPGILPLLESLEDKAAGHAEQTDAYLTIANRLSGEEGRHFLPAVEKHFSRLGKTILTHITSSNAELSQAALQALGFCVYHSHVSSAVPEASAAEILSALCSLVVKSTDKNTCIRALWVISKQTFPSDVVAKKVSSVLGTLESVLSREDIQSVVLEHEALNVIIRMLEQAPAQMGEGAVRWAKLVIPLVVHSASKVRLRAAAAMEMGMPLLLGKQMEVAAIIEPLMSTKLIPELQKLFMSKNETNVLKLWPLFVKLLGKMLHRGGPFINSLLHLEELGFRNSSPTIKKIAFIAWKSLIDNFSLNPDILCSAKRIKLLMQPLTSIHVRTEALLLTKVEVWWYLAVQLGPNLSSNFDQVSLPLLQCTIGCDSLSVPGTPSRAVAQNGAAAPVTPKTGTPAINSAGATPRMNLNSSIQVPSTYPSIQLLGLEMLFHYFLGPEVVAAAAKRKLTLSLEPLNHPLLSGASSFTKHAAVLISNIRDGFTNIGKDAPDSLLAVIWTSLVRFVNLTIESGVKKDRQGCEVLTLMLQALQSIVTSEALPADRVLILFEATVKGIPQRVLGSASYQVGKMDVLNGTPALYLILLLYNSSMLSAYIEDERFFQCLQMLVGCGLSGHTSPLAFSESVLGAIGGSAGSVQNKEQLWRMWSAVVGPLTDTITQSNEVNQGDALEHNFSAMHCALLFPVTHFLRGSPLQQAAQKSMLSTWSKLYKVFARCSALVVTAEENICCEELCAKITASVDKDVLVVPSNLNAITSVLHVMVECVDFSPYSPQFQQKLKSPHTPVNWMKKRNKALGNLFTFQSLLVQCLEFYLENPEASSEATGVALISIMSTLFANLVLTNAVQEAFASLIQPLTLFYKRAASDPPEFTSQILLKLEKLFGDVLGCLQSRSALAFDDELLALLSPLLCVLFPHKNKHLRTSVTQFWNATFANSVSINYPEEIRPILSHVKQTIPIILPGFEAVTVSDEHSEQYSSESSQLETKLSGMPISSAGKRDSLLGKAAEPNDKSSKKTSKAVSTKLDFGSPKPPRREVLEEEASIDFVFIPPETKQRVLTEHQKEVKRTKRVDIPAMYNNLDASLDTTVFSQYTQSQEDSSEDKLPTEQVDKMIEETLDKVPPEESKNKDHEVLIEENKDVASPTEAENKMIPESSSDVSMEEEAKAGDKSEDMDTQSKEEDLSPSLSGSSDLVSGTPQKPNSRRQSFITLEKYGEGKPASPNSGSIFAGRLVKTPKTQERNDAKKSPPSQPSQTSTTSNSQDIEKTDLQHPVNSTMESPRRPKDSGIATEPVKLTERLPSDTTEDEDVIPDTQAEAEGKGTTKVDSTSENMESSSQEEEMVDSQSSATETSPVDPQLSGRSRVKPLLPGEDPEESEKKHSLLKRKRSGEESKSDPPKTSPVQSRVTRRSLQVAEEEIARAKLRTRAQKERSDLSQTNSQGRPQKKMKLFSNSGNFLDKPESKRRTNRERESSQTDLSDSDSPSQGSRRGRRSKASLENEEKGLKKRESEQSSQTATQELEVVEQTEKDDHKPERDSQVFTASQEVDLAGMTKKDVHEVKTDSQLVTSSPQSSDKPDNDEPKQTKNDDPVVKDDSQMMTLSAKTGDGSQEFVGKDDSEPKLDSPVVAHGQSQEFELVKKTKLEKIDSPIVASSTSESQDGSNVLGNELEVKDKDKTMEKTDDGLSQDDSQAITPLSSDSQSVRKSRRSKASPDGAESEDKSDNKNSMGRQSRSSSKTNISAVSQAEASIGGRTRRSKAHEELPKSSPSSTPEGSQSLDTPGSTESSQGKGRYTRRKSSQALASVESSEPKSPGAREPSTMPKKRGRKPRSSLPSPLTIESQEDRIDGDMVNDAADSQEVDTQSIEAENATHVEKALASVESSGPKSTGTREPSTMPKKRGRKPRASLQSPLTLESQENRIDDLVNVAAAADDSQEVDTQSIEAGNVTDVEESQQIQDLPQSQSLVEEEQQVNESPMEVEVDTVAPAEPVALEKTEIDDTETRNEPPCKNEQSNSVTNVDGNSSQEKDTGDREILEEKSIEQVKGNGSSDCPFALDEQVPSDGTTEAPQVSESSEDKAEDVSETGGSGDGNQMADSDHEHPVVPQEGTVQNQIQSVNELSKEDEQPVSNEQMEAHASNEDEVPPLQENADDVETQIEECRDEDQTQKATTENNVAVNLDAALSELCDAPVAADSMSNNVFQDSPVKQKDLEALMASDIGQSPSSGRIRGTWSPSASPSTSILKKGQKRPLEEDTPSPLVKSRRVSFADPIQHQEIADDIDRRSPAVRTSSPRRSRISAIPQPKFITTPTKGVLILSPRNLRNPGFKSSKKCLISEMSLEPRPVPRDCIYPALVGCSAPVEAVLPQISSNMWSRGFGQLVRARNIKTVGDLSALTPTEIKTLPIRSPKISNVKKALKIYEHQRKGRSVDDLKSFDETEMMASELEETSAPQNQDEEDKTSTETLATELVDEPVPAEERLPPQQQEEEDVSDDQTPAGEHPPPEEQLHPVALPSEVEALACRMTPLELSSCSPHQLVQMHERLGGMMGRVVVELQTRLSQTESKT
ncbi:telomere-associated protein RIF1 [Solea senegalensis]|uniref:Telomere-associated protein RIF1 n=1 Tax=Solea senegalensis TaxID=28829 RepID=A0AAV6P809_SOLSE|nr:telomere-associated protein RIF1 [Solea senegalensis]KAG7453450.1 telomere-associated protein RIF1 [Solea senegalensis]